MRTHPVLAAKSGLSVVRSAASLDRAIRGPVSRADTPAIRGASSLSGGQCLPRS